MGFLERLGLVPKGLSYTTHQNIIPRASNALVRINTSFSVVRKDIHARLDIYEWCFLPIDDVMFHYIAYEEHQLTLRESSDTGRLSYLLSYDAFPSASRFHLFFSDAFPASLSRDPDVVLKHLTNDPDHPFPTVDLIASVNIIIKQMPSFMGDRVDPQGEVSNLHTTFVCCLMIWKRSAALAFYLRKLWIATPGTFRSLPRPTSLNFTIDGAGTYFSQSLQLVIPALNTSINQMNPHLAGNFGGAMEEIGDRTLDLDGGDSDYHSDEDLRASSLGSHVAEGSPRGKDLEDHSSMTANEWAFLMYRTDLKGDPRKYQIR